MQTTEVNWQLRSILVVLVLVLTGHATPATDIQEAQDRFESNKKTIPVEVFEPKAAGKYPGIVLVHGADSLSDKGWLEFYRNLARGLARNGFVVVMPHYLKRTDTKTANGEAIGKHFTAWSQTIGDAVTYLGKRPRVDAKRLGITGASLGASLALTESAFDPRIGAVVDYFGTLPDWVPRAASGKRKPAMPPVLILHGDRDFLVPVKEAKKLERYLKDNKLTYDMKIYANQGHGFKDEALKDSAARTLKFFRQHLGE